MNHTALDARKPGPRRRSSHRVESRRVGTGRAPDGRNRLSTRSEEGPESSHLPTDLPFGLAATIATHVAFLAGALAITAACVATVAAHPAIIATHAAAFAMHAAIIPTHAATIPTCAATVAMCVAMVAMCVAMVAMCVAIIASPRFTLLRPSFVNLNRQMAPWAEVVGATEPKASYVLSRGDIALRKPIEALRLRSG